MADQHIHIHTEKIVDKSTGPIEKETKKEYQLVPEGYIHKKVAATEVIVYAQFTKLGGMGMILGAFLTMGTTMFNQTYGAFAVVIASVFGIFLYKKGFDMITHLKKTYSI